MPADSLILTYAARRRVTTHRALSGTMLGIGAAIVATSAVFAVGNLGAPIRVVTGWSPNGAQLTYAEVVLTAATAVALGGLLLWWMERRWTAGFPVWQRIAAGIAIVSALPLLRLDVDADSKVSLVSMHLLTGTCAIAAHRLVRARRIEGRDPVEHNAQGSAI